MAGIASPDLSELKFNVAKEEVVRRFSNWSVARPDAHADHYANLAILPHWMPIVDELADAEACTNDALI